MYYVHYVLLILNFIISLLHYQVEKYIQALREDILQSPHLQFAMRVVTCRRTKSYATFFRLIKESNYLQACCLFKYVGYMRLQALSIIGRSVRIGKQDVYFPLSDLCRLLLFESEEETEDFLAHCKVEVSAVCTVYT